jgi:class 3 adenylate cyclase
VTQRHSEVSLLIAFVDLARFAAQSQRLDDHAIAQTLDGYYEHVAAAIQHSGGTVVKFIGDAALIVFPESRVDQGVETLLALKSSVDQMMEDRAWQCRLTVKVHFGTAIAGPFGARNEKRFDVIGKAVNTAAMLDATGVTLSADAFQKLSKELRSHFKKHAPPASYIRVEDQPGFRRTARA